MKSATKVQVLELWPIMWSSFCARKRRKVATWLQKNKIQWINYIGSISMTKEIRGLNKGLSNGGLQWVHWGCSNQPLASPTSHFSAPPRPWCHMIAQWPPPKSPDYDSTMNNYNCRTVLTSGKTCAISPSLQSPDSPLTLIKCNRALTDHQIMFILCLPSTRMEWKE